MPLVSCQRYASPRRRTHGKESWSLHKTCNPRFVELSIKYKDKIYLSKEIYHVGDLPPGFFHKLFGGGFVFGDDFRSPSGTESDGETRVGAESDEGGLGKIVH